MWNSLALVTASALVHSSTFVYCGNGISRNGGFLSTESEKKARLSLEPSGESFCVHKATHSPHRGAIALNVALGASLRCFRDIPASFGKKSRNPPRLTPKASSSSTQLLVYASRFRCMGCVSHAFWLVFQFQRYREKVSTELLTNS